MPLSTTRTSVNLTSLRACHSAPYLPAEETAPLLQVSDTDLFESCLARKQPQREESPAKKSNDEPTTEGSSLSNYIPETTPGKIIALVGLFYAGKLAWRGATKIADITGIAEATNTIRIMGLNTSLDLIKELGLQRSYEMNQAEGLAVPIGLAKYMGVKKTMQLAWTLGPVKVFELLKP